MAPPTFSVILCNNNYGKFLPMCLSGIFRQSFSDFEVVIADYGSTDGSIPYLRDYSAREPRLKPHFLKKGTTLLEAVEVVLARANGRYLFAHGVDDFIVHPDYFKDAHDALEQFPQAAGFYGLAALYQDETKQITKTIGCCHREGFVPPTECYRKFLEGPVFIPGSASIWRLDLLRAIGGYDYTLGPQLDFLNNHLLAAQHGVVFSGKAYTCQRVFAKTKTYGRQASLWEAAARHQRVEQIIREKVPAYEGMEEDWVKWRARWMMSAIDASGVKV